MDLMMLGSVATIRPREKGEGREKEETLLEKIFYIFLEIFLF